MKLLRLCFKNSSTSGLLQVQRAKFPCRGYHQKMVVCSIMVLTTATDEK